MFIKTTMYLAVTAILIILIPVNSLLLIEYFINNHTPSEQTIYSITLINLIGLIVILHPFISMALKNISNERVKEFLDLPNKESKFTFLSFSNFLGEQALAAFLATILAFTGSHAFQNYGGLVAAIYVFLLLVVTATLAGVSFLRFLSYLSKYNSWVYLFGASFAAGIAFSFYRIGIELAPKITN